MKAKVIILFWVLMFSAYAGIVFAGNEIGNNTWYGQNAGAASPTGAYNAFFGESAGRVTSTGCCNAFFGRYAGYNNTTGESNVFIGNNAGQDNIAGTNNTFLGRLSGTSNTASQNTYVGAYSGYTNTTGTGHVFIGYEAGKANTTGEDNVYLGHQAGTASTTADYNVFIGSGAGLANTTGARNVFIGRRNGESNTTGIYNTSVGGYTGQSNTTGYYNLFLGYRAGYNNTVENHNSFIGAHSDGAVGVTNATAIGYRAHVTQSNSLVLGSINGVNGATADTNVGIGTTAPVRQLHVVGDQAVFRMDRPADTAAFMLVRTDAGGTPLKTFVVGANASGSNTGSFVINDLGTAVSGAGTRRLTIDNNGIATFTNSVYALSFVPTSSRVYKTNVKTYENALETVKKLRGVSFNWKESGKPSVGLIAEEVDQVIPAVVAHDGKDTVGVNYDSLVGVLVEAVKEQEKTLQEQMIIVEQQQNIIAAHSKEIADLKRLVIILNAVSKAD